jgi:CheY-like chemotaxis protein
MDEATMKRIFEPFFTTKERGKGTGIGLATVYGTVKQHNGHIEVASIPNQGTTFDVYLPITDAVENGSVGNDAKAAVAARSPEAASTSSKTVKTLLVAEDEAAVRDSVVKILRHAGYRVISAGNGEDAVLKFREHAGDIDLLVFDVMMPGKNGKEAYNEIKKIKPAVKTIFMSGYSEDMATNREIQEEGLLFLQKPVIIPKLLEKIRDVLAQQGCGK